MSKSGNTKVKARKNIKVRLQRITARDFVDFLLIEGIAGDREPSAEEQRAVRREKKDRGRKFYGDVLFTLVQQDMGETKARKTWRNILVHKAKLSAMLGRRVGISVAAMDYFANFRDHWGEPVIVDGRKIAAVEEQVMNDGISSLRDTALFQEQLELEIYRYRRYGSPLSLAVAKLDDLGEGNGEEGRQEIDTAIPFVTEELKRASRRLDSVARIGVGKLALLMPQTEVKKATRIAERIRKRVERRYRESPNVTLSIGVAGCPKNAQKPNSLMKRCDEALRKAKREGGNCVAIR